MVNLQALTPAQAKAKFPAEAALVDRLVSIANSLGPDVVGPNGIQFYDAGNRVSFVVDPGAVAAINLALSQP